MDDGRHGAGPGGAGRAGGAGPRDAGQDDRVGYGPAGAAESAAANRAWWDGASGGYLEEHGATLGTDRLVWGPEGLDEEDAELLGPRAGLAGARALEVGCGAGQGARWVRAQGADAVGVDLSLGMLRRSRALDAAGRAVAGQGTAGQGTAGQGTAGQGTAGQGTAGQGTAGAHRGPVPVLQADARALPLAAGWADVAFSAYGALPFVADVGAVLAEVARVLAPGGRWVFSTTHPVRWGFPDSPGPEGLTAHRSYFDRTPYAERSPSGRLVYAEHHRTLGDWVRLVVAAGLTVEDLVEPEWPARGVGGREQPTWGGWSALRGALLPGTLVLACRRAA